MFTGNKVSADIIRKFINNPANAINLQSDAHDSMDKRLAWGIEARWVNDEVRVMRLRGVTDPDITELKQWKYYFRAVNPAGVPVFVKYFIQDGGEIKLGKGEDRGTIA